MSGPAAPGSRRSAYEKELLARLDQEKGELKKLRRQLRQPKKLRRPRTPGRLPWLL